MILFIVNIPSGKDTLLLNALYSCLLPPFSLLLIIFNIKPQRDCTAKGEYELLRLP